MFAREISERRARGCIVHRCITAIPRLNPRVAPP
jgi:hypothetical protein